MTKRELDELTATRQHFQTFNTYTKLPEGSPSWVSFWEEERRRCLEGYHIGSDYITGYFYDYLNYSRITLLKSESGSIKATEVIDFPEFWDGHKEFFDYCEEAENLGEHGMFYGSRGKSKSWIGASMLNRNYFHIKASKSYAIASDYQFLTEDGILSPKAWSIQAFRDAHTPWAKRRQIHNTNLHRKASKKVKNSAGIEVEDGWLSEIIGLSVSNDNDKIRGKRGKLAIIEEAGIRMMLPAFEQGSKTRGFILLLGTGGTDGASGQGIINIFKNPSASRIHGVTNIWSPGQQNIKCGFFYPFWKNFDGAYDELGISNREKAEELFEDKYGKIRKSNDPFAWVKLKAEWPTVPEDAMMKISGTQFPVYELRQQEAEIETKPHLYRNAETYARFELNTDTQLYEYKIDTQAKPIYDFPHQDNKNMPGAFIIYEHPKIDPKTNKPYMGRYVAGGDSYDFDESTTTSLGSLFVGDLWTKRIVAEYTGRPQTAREFYENCRKGLLYYNAEANFENLNRGIFQYFEDKGCIYLLSEQLNIEREVLSDNGSLGHTTRRGTGANPKVMQYARGLGAQYLLESTNNPTKPEEMLIHKLKCLPLAKELIAWNADGNFDRVIAFCMLMLIMREREKFIEDGTYTIPTNYIGNDPFFNKLLPKSMQKQLTLPPKYT